MTARPPATERLVDAYLHDLERALAHLEVDERRDVVDSVREHIDAALEEHGRVPTPGDVQAVLRRLGPVEHIAHNAYHGSPSPHGDTGNHDDAQDPLPAATGYLLAALIIGMALSASLLITRIPPFFRPEGGDPLAVAQLTWVFIVLSVAAGIIKRNTRT